MPSLQQKQWKSLSMLRPNKNQALWRECKKRLNSQTWFPQVPLAMVSALIGLVSLAPLLTDNLGLNLLSKLVAGTDSGLAGLSLLGLSRSAIGALLLVMALGLWLRLRLAWLTTILLIVTALLFHFNATTAVVSWWRIFIDGFFFAGAYPVSPSF